MPKETSRAIILKDDTLLVIHRINERGDYYVFPGGHIEKSENPEQALIREIQEETSVDIKVRKLFDTYVYKTKGYYFLCDYISGEPQLSVESEEFEVQSEKNIYEFQWVTVNEMKGLLLYPDEIKHKLVPMLLNQS